MRRASTRHERGAAGRFAPELRDTESVPLCESVGAFLEREERPLEEIETDIRTIEKDIVRMLAEVPGATGPDLAHGWRIGRSPPGAVGGPSAMAGSLPVPSEARRAGQEPGYDRQP